MYLNRFPYYLYAKFSVEVIIEFPFYIIAGLVVVAFIAGFISSIAGAGGMIVLPFLLWAGVPPIHALATNKFQSVFGTLSSTINFFRNGHIDFSKLRAALGYAFVGACAGTFAVQKIPSDRLGDLMPWLLILLALYFAFSPRISDQDTTARISNQWFSLFVGGGIGFYGGFFGPGMGSICAVAFTGLLGYNMCSATASTKPLVLVTNTTSMLIFVWQGYVVWDLVLSMAVAQFFGARLGSGIVIKKGTTLIKPVIIVVTLAIALKLLIY